MKKLFILLGMGMIFSLFAGEVTFSGTVQLPNGVKLEMVKIKAGSFMMGSPIDEKGRGNDEKQHLVTLSKNFWMGKYEVTQRQWDAVMGHNPSYFTKGGDYPVEQVSWLDAKKFCDKLNELYAEKLPQGYRFDLPTEAQWEYACRAGTTTALNNGKNLTSSRFGYCSNLNEVGWYCKNNGKKTTHEVGEKAPNAWGLYDMHGNVSEWCRDWYGPYDGDATDPTGPATGSKRVLRGGGGGLTFIESCRSASRRGTFPGNRGNDLGFRLALVPVPVHLAKVEFPSIVILPGNVKLEMVKVKSGSFVMGCPAGECPEGVFGLLGRNAKQHKVTLTKDYWLGKYEVTQEEWKAVMGTTPSRFRKGDRYPVETVTWHDAKEFCNKLNKLYEGKLPQGYRFDLPTEAQWEYACRAGTTTALNNGKNLTSVDYCSNVNEVAWYHGNSDATTHEVGGRAPNAWGLYDMHGNVSEWCRDWYGPYDGDATDPTGPATGSGRVSRGGSWFAVAIGCRSSGRSDISGSAAIGFTLGFRLALVPVPVHLTKSAEQGNAEAQLKLGHCYRKGEGVEKNPEEAVKWYRKSAEQGNAEGQKWLGYCYRNGIGVKKAPEEAVKWYRKSAEQGNADAQNKLGFCYESGQGVEKDLGEAVKWYRKSADQGDASAQLELGFCYRRGEGVEKDLKESVKWFRKSAEQGDALAQLWLGICYLKGEGVEKDLKESVKWFRKSAGQGNARAQNMLGLCYYQGRGVEKDYTEAVKWYRKAADQGRDWAQVSLGRCYRDGRGVEKDYAEAVKWFRKAAEQGYAVAQVILGTCYYRGNGVEKDLEEAVKWYRKSAAQGDALAKLWLGYCYRYGTGVEKNLEEAVKWYRKAAAQGNASAKKALEELGRE